MKFKRILLFGIVMIFMTGTLSTEAATTQSSAALAPWTTGVIDQAAGKRLGQHVSIDHYEHNGRAYISYYDATGGDLELAYEVDAGTGDCPGNANWQCETVDTGFIFMLTNDDVGQYSSIDVIDETIYLTTGNQDDINAQPPHYHRAKIGISYYNATAKSLKFAIGSCSVSAGCSWDKTEVDDSAADEDTIGTFSSFQFGSDTNKTPIIYYHSQNVISLFFQTGRVKHAYVTTNVSGRCDAGWVCEVVAQSSESASYGTHVSADGGRVVFYDSKYDDLLMARSTGSIMSNSCGLVNYWDCDVIDSTDNVGKFASLYYDAEHPMQVVYYDATAGTVKYAKGLTTATGNCTNNYFNCSDVDTIGTTTLPGNIGLSLTLDAEGQPIIAYQDFSEDPAPTALKIARPSSVYDLPVGNCGDVPPGYLYNYWQCSYLDGGGTWVNEAEYAAVSVSPAGLATVAYYETDDYNEEGHLKVAQQHFMVYLPLIKK